MGNDAATWWRLLKIVLLGREQAVDLSSLASLGEIAGLGGIALGVVVLLVRPMIDRVSAVPVAERGPTLRLLAMGAFGIGALGIVAWLIGGVSGDSTTGAPGAITTGGHGTANNNTVINGAVPAIPPAKP